MVQLNIINRRGLVNTRAICWPIRVHEPTDGRLIAPKTAPTNKTAARLCSGV